jgi:hypothetical protein
MVRLHYEKAGTKSRKRGNQMICPISIYYYEKIKSSSGYYECIRQDGKKIPELIYRLVKGNHAGVDVIELVPLTRKKGSLYERTPWGLNNRLISFLHPELVVFDEQGKKHRPRSLSNLYEKDVNRPGEGYGTIRCTDYVFLSRRDSVKETMKLMVFEEHKGQEEMLFLSWGNNGVSEVLPNNRLYFTLKTDIFTDDEGDDD